MDISSRDFLKQKSSPKKRAKFNAVKKNIDGFCFDSKLEAKRYVELKNLHNIGIIKNLGVHVKFPLFINDIKVTTYEADFVYTDSDDNYIVEDTKGVLTPEYRIKKKLMRAILDIDIIEIYANKK